ncbi:hypothetical protein ACLESO_03300 [Pyxidicoccus sp. 3LG]
MLGHVFERYKELESHTTGELAIELGCSAETLQWLSICRRPEEASFAEHVRVIANRFALDPSRLSAVLRRVEVLDALAAHRDVEGAAGEDSLLLAARDRLEDEETSS